MPFLINVESFGQEESLRIEKDLIFDTFLGV